ncbi:beta-N-acetylhexosaminidase [Streptomyces sp. WAC06614]|uniref:beta-N-acetylhexosaminidase n=1 Tax=Streptomyces sp. WAC06614 TaxID=2487416 RepID=UPI000F770B8F|nr:beta-N-acetylhexosaminidase [Streptomyces sp. WAC06614]RSS83889.1 beta-N-acetylhexosaminidase [Streptomyces sp. WAC06614]
MRVLRTCAVLLALAATLSCTAARGAGHDGRSGDDGRPGEGRSAGPRRVAELGPYERLLPAPLGAQGGGPGYALAPGTVIRTPVGDREVRRTGERLAGELRARSGFPLPVVDGTEGGGVVLRLDRAEDTAGLGEEGYRLETTARAVTLTARTPAGLFHAVQSLRQLLPAPGAPAVVPGGRITDAPRFAYRGALLDIARHFFTVEQVEAYVDQLAQYKINTLHLHLTDDQGWRLDIASWPRLAAYGGASEVGGGPGGAWSKEDYRRLVAYAAERYVEVVPEIDMPGHTNAALASYAELTCDGKAPARYTGIKVGFSSLCVAAERTYDFVDDVLREVAELTPGRYLHIGGDEAHATKPADYAAFMDRAQQVVARYGKTVVAWHQLAGARPAPGAVLQYWGHDRTPAADKAALAEAVRRGHRLILSPADHAYLDMKYDSATGPGLAWAGYVPVRRAYSWDPGAHLPDVPESAVLGVEAALWTETVATVPDLHHLAFPRALSLAELAWSPATSHDWPTHRLRLAAQSRRLTAQGIAFYRSPEVPWE